MIGCEVGSQSERELEKKASGIEQAKLISFSLDLDEGGTLKFTQKTQVS